MILLASRSPQRRALLAGLGVAFRVVAPRAEEGEDPLANARAKAREVAARAGVPEGGAVLGADTEVILEGRVLGTPPDAAAARHHLTALAGRTHVVCTAICVITQRDERELVDDARVTFRPLGDEAIDRYVATGEWRDRAGGYAIQGAGAALVERVDGDESTVVGLPVARLAALLQELGLLP
ncbi:MAG TPA: Maf family protein [Miltoncostaeaceae bacterium]|nr:Maf family protein [Miltoncostaeaceae bacterium]